MKGKELFNVLILCCCLLILSGSFLPYVSVNFENTNAGWAARSVIQEQLPEMFDQETGNFSATAVDIIASMQTENRGGVAKWWFIATMFLNLLSVLCLLIRRNVKYVLIILLDLMQIALWFGGIFLVLPWVLVWLSGISTTSFTDASLFGLTRVTEIMEIRSQLVHGMRLGYWMPYFFAILSVILCVAALLKKPGVSKRAEKKRPMEWNEGPYRKEPGNAGAAPYRAEYGNAGPEGYRPEHENAGPEGYRGEPGDIGSVPYRDAPENMGSDAYRGEPVNVGSAPYRPESGIAPGITCVEGPYAGSHADMDPEEEMIVGSDEEACSLVIISSLVEGRHCAVRFDARKNAYQVKSLEPAVTTVIGIGQVENDIWLPLERGTCVKLGADENILRLD